VSLCGVLILLWSRAPLGSPLFFGVTAVLMLAYGALLARVWAAPPPDRRALALALLFAVAFRLPLALAPVGSDSDMERYRWDGRVQALGYNPYAVRPADAAMAGTHTAQSIDMPSRHDRTPYPPAAQLFFRLVVSLHDSLLGMKLALVAADLATIVILRRWLLLSGRSEWLTLAYAWNPLVILEVAHSGHVDALGTMWLVMSAYFLTARRAMLGTLAFVLAVSTKLLPIVLAPLLIGRIRARDAVAGGLLLGALYLHFLDPASPALGAVPNVVDYVRFNGPVFRAVAAVSSGRVAAAVALLAGLGAAVVARRRLPVSDPAGWAWPMATALAAAPVVYPWYLLFLTPFLWTRATLPLLTWCCSGLAAYVVWHLSRGGARWSVPAGVQLFEYAAPMVTIAVLAVMSRAERQKLR
jgi:hypothetical protein